MKIGLSSYSLFQAFHARQLTAVEAVQWVADNGGEHIEISTAGLTLSGARDAMTAVEATPEGIREAALRAGIDISSYTIGANFLLASPEALEAEIQRVIGEVDIAVRLGAKLMRHDVASRPADQAGLAQFAADMPQLVHACRAVADYAAQHGITTSVENHGLHMQHSDRVQWLIREVDRPNFRTTMDIGNFLCVDEDPGAAVRNNLPYASMIHVKDFYRRPPTFSAGEGWFRTRGGNFLRGAIVGHGDMDMPTLLGMIKNSGYDGYMSIEFEGMEDCRLGARLGMENARRIWNEVKG